MYLNYGYRGLSFIPYPDHIKDMIYDIDKKTKKVDPENKRKYIIYKGSEIVPNFDKNLVNIKKEVAPIFARAMQEKDEKAKSLIQGLDSKLKKRLSSVKKKSVKTAMIEVPKQVVIKQEEPAASLDIPRRNLFKITLGIDAVTGKPRKNIFYNPKEKSPSKKKWQRGQSKSTYGGDMEPVTKRTSQTSPTDHVTKDDDESSGSNTPHSPAKVPEGHRLSLKPENLIRIQETQMASANLKRRAFGASKTLSNFTKYISVEDKEQMLKDLKAEQAKKLYQ